VPFIPAAGSSSASNFGFGGQGAGNLEPALVAVGKVLGQIVRPFVNTDVVQKLLGATSNRRLFGHRRPIANDRTKHARMRTQMPSDHHVLDRRHVPEQANVLKRAGNPDFGRLVRSVGGQLLRRRRRNGRSRSCRDRSGS
jgi:hypothetical protein